MFVGTLSSVLTRLASRPTELRAWFPDYKPDPVFRVATDGTITDSGAMTRTLFDQQGISTAQEVLGTDVWTKLQAAASEGRTVTTETVAVFGPAGTRYSVRHAPAPNGDINIYMTANI